MNLGERVELLFQKIKLLALRQRSPRWRVAVALGVLPLEVASNEERLLIEPGSKEDMLARLVHIDRGIGFVLGVSLAHFNLARTTGSNQVDTGKFAVRVGLLQFLLHRVGEVLDSELERGLPCRHLILAGECIDIALVILGDRERSEVELGEVEGIVLPAFNQDRRRAKRTPVEIEFVDFRVEIGPAEFGLHDLGATLEPLLDLVLALHRLRRFQRKPAAFQWGHP